MKILIVAAFLALAFAGLVFLVVDQLFFALGRTEVRAPAPGRERGSVRAVDLRPSHDHDILPRYIDVDVGDVLHLTKANGEEMDIRIVSVRIDNRSFFSPRTRVDLTVGGRSYAAFCGVPEEDQSGIRPVEIDGVKLAVEATRLLFSKMKRGSSPFNSYRNLRLRGDLRLAVWDASRPILRGVKAQYPLDPAKRSGIGVGNWLHATPYGIHCAIDIFAAQDGVPEEVVSPVDAIVYKVYNRDAAPDDPHRSKAINLYATAIVGPRGEKLLIRMQHLSEILVSAGQFVPRGETVGMTGHTGFDPRIGDHLHFEIRLNPSAFGYDMDDDIFASVPVNPYNYLIDWHEAGQRPTGG